MAKAILDFAAIRGITTHLTPAETDLSGAIASNAELMASIIRAGAPMNISPIVAHQVIATLSSANTDLVAGFGKTVEVHHQLAELRDRLGLRTVAFGGGLYKGDDSVIPRGSAVEAPVATVRLAASA